MSLPALMRVVIESPFRGSDEAELARNVLYAEACMLHAFSRGEAPFLGHLLYPRVLDDAHPDDRRLGIEAHCAWIASAELVAVYTDLGVTDGMRLAIEHTRARHNIPIVFRTLGADWQARLLAEAHRTAAFH